MAVRGKRSFLIRRPGILKCPWCRSGFQLCLCGEHRLRRTHMRRFARLRYWRGHCTYNAHLLTNLALFLASATASAVLSHKGASATYGAEAFASHPGDGGVRLSASSFGGFQRRGRVGAVEAGQTPRHHARGCLVTR